MREDTFIASLGFGMFAVWFVIWLTIVIGYILNMMKLIGTDLEVETVEFVLRAVGVVMLPLGAVMGIFVG